MALDRWADYYAALKRDGGSEIVEDDDFDLGRVLEDAARRSGDEDWEPVETWTHDSD